jgi:hypothetical protein
MRNSPKAEDSISEGASTNVNPTPKLQIVATGRPSHKPSITDKEIFSYIEELSLELGALSVNSDQALLAFLFKCAALEARRQGWHSGRIR